MTQMRVTVEEDEIDYILSALNASYGEESNPEVKEQLSKYVQKWIRVYEKHWEQK
jgi:hypothetical protein